FKRFVISVALRLSEITSIQLATHNREPNGFITFRSTVVAHRVCYYFQQAMCYDGPFWDDARLRHGDVTGVLELECWPFTVGGSVGVRVSSDSSVLCACVFSSVDSVIVCES
ncbi:hypothetical protein Tsp_13003, partial [Trichinella spiralis]|uniref:hypothetical protein n=1 Tax=Trichinella spiralis TaxID=6334 RepID=UPI0001EFDA54